MAADRQGGEEVETRGDGMRVLVHVPVFMVCSFVAVLIVGRRSERIGKKVKAAAMETEKQVRCE
jgi:K+-transporting ATPase A subunit